MDDATAAMIEGQLPPPDMGALDPLAGLDPAMPPPPPAFPSTSPDAIAMAVQDALLRLAEEDHAMLQMQQQQAMMMAQPIIDQMVSQASAPPPPMGMPPAPMPMPMGPPMAMPAPPVDPMVAYGEGSLPPAPGLM